MGDQEIICPFCKQDNFDLIGLKDHFHQGYCEVFNETITPAEERAQRILKNIEDSKP